MKRLYSYLEDTFPFINDDFNNVLQNQHMIAYSAYLDGINDEKYSTYSTNRGIVLSGIDVTATPNQSASDKFDWQVKIGPSSLVYFDGQYYNPDSTLTNGDLQDVTLSYKNVYCVFIYPFTQSISRQFKNDQLGTQSFSIDYRFNIIPHGYPASVTQLTPQYPGKTMGVPYILYEFGGTSRNLSRLLKLSTTVKDDIQITYNPKSWPIPVQGSGWLSYSDGYIYRDFETKTQSTYTGFKMGRNELKGFAVLDDMGGRFMVGYDSTSNTSPQNAGLNVFNYGLPGNVGGTQGVTFSASQLPAHNHGGFTDKTTQNLDHAHIFFAGNPVEYQYNSGYLDARAVGLGSPPIGANNEVFLTRSLPYWIQQTDYGVPEDNVDFTNHKHEIYSVGQDKPHENRPPYMVTLFYYKL